jgi:hypothetical protein
MSFPTSGELRTRKRYSSSYSPDPYNSYKGNAAFHHELWLADTDPEPSPDDRRGLLIATAYLDSNGKASDKGPVTDRYHYKIAYSIASLAHKGFRPALSAMGIEADWLFRDVYFDRRCTIRISFPDAAQAVRLGSAALDLGTDNPAPARFTLLPPGRYTGESFSALLADGAYPLSQGYATGEKESPYAEQGSHDILTHAPAMLAAGNTPLFGRLQQRIMKLQQADSYDSYGRMMRDVDSTLNVLTFSEITNETASSSEHIRRMLDIYSGNVETTCVETLRANMHAPLTAGYLALSA